MLHFRFLLVALAFVFARPGLAQTCQGEDLIQAIQRSIQSYGCDAKAETQWRYRYRDLVKELRKGMKKIGSLYPVDASEDINPVLRWGAEELTDNAEMMSDVPAILASNPAPSSGPHWLLAYLIATENWTLGSYVHFDSGISGPLQRLPFQAEVHLPAFSTDPDFEGKVQAALTHVAILEQSLQEYIAVYGTAHGLVPQELYSNFELHSLQVASPMVRWLLSQKRRSVSAAQLFTAAEQIYHDPRLAIAVISYVLWLDNAAVNSRAVSAVLTSKLLPFCPSDKDINGSLYHFWGYVRRGMSGDESWRLSILSFGHEIIGQGDRSERTADTAGIAVGAATYQALTSCN